MSPTKLQAALVDAVGDEQRVAVGDSERDLHASDITFHRPHRPDVVGARLPVRITVPSASTASSARTLARIFP